MAKYFQFMPSCSLDDSTMPARFTGTTTNDSSVFNVAYGRYDMESHRKYPVYSLSGFLAGEHNLRYMLPETKTALRTVLTADNQLNVTSGLTIQELRGWNGFLRILDD
eukprot:gb/GECG01015785.1/.p1 GENE.gb/GECG01015785.1/~~gb/GECG01015785.1/.p1  ORF type:complete len:108 (+),score=12.34 gb/GECG01015785.1/:1-324(+)